MTPDPMKDIKRFALLGNRKAKLKVAMDKVDEEAKKLEPWVLSFLEQNALEKPRFYGRLVHVVRETPASIVGLAGSPEREEAMETLKAHPATAFLVKDNVNWRTLQAFVKDLREADCVDSEGLPVFPVEEHADNRLHYPSDIKKVIKVSEIYRVRTRK